MNNKDDFGCATVPPGNSTDASRVPLSLLLATTDERKNAVSGYTSIARHLRHSKLISEFRQEPRSCAQRLIVGLLSRMAFTRWYRRGSLQVEARAWQAIPKNFQGMVHYLWGDRDMGYLDLLPRPHGVALCATIHSCPDSLPHNLQFPLRFRRVDGFILMSAVQRAFFEERGVSPDRLHVVHHGVDCEFFKPTFQAASDGFTVLSVGNYRRNFQLLREVCERLRAWPSIKVRIIAPPEKQLLFSGLPNVEFGSGLSDQGLLEAYQQASCLLMTLEAATANNAILEAMACGLPVVAEDVGGVAEYTGTEAGRLCAPGDASALADAIVSLQSQPQNRPALGRQFRQRAETLSWEKVARRTEAVYQEILEESLARRGIHLKQE